MNNTPQDGLGASGAEQLKKDNAVLEAKIVLNDALFDELRRLNPEPLTTGAAFICTAASTEALELMVHKLDDIHNGARFEGKEVDLCPYASEEGVALKEIVASYLNRMQAAPYWAAYEALAEAKLHRSLSTNHSGTAEGAGR